MLALLAGGCSPDEAACPNVLLVSFDTTRADALGCYGAGPGASATVDRLAAEGVRFEFAISPAPLTLPSHTTMLTGLDPPRHRVRDNAVYDVPEEARTLAEILGEAGFRTFAEVASIVLLRRHRLDQGFGTYGQGSLGTGSDEALRRDAQEIVAAVLPALGASEPFFGFVHFYDPHQPIEVAPERIEAHGGDAYAAAVAYTDAALGRIVERLEELGRLDRTLIVVTSDHGESLGEHGEATHGMLLYDQTQRVPLVLRHPALQPAVVADQLAQLADLTPTVLDFLGLQVPPDLDGRSLLSVLAGTDPIPGEAYMETLAPHLSFDWAPLFGVRTMSWKLVVGSRPHLFELRADPGEERDLARSRPEVVERLTQRLAFLRDERGTPLSETTRTLFGDDLARLGGLGYVGSRPAADLEIDADLPDPHDHTATFNAINRASRALDDGRHEEAMVGFHDVLERAPGTYLALQGLGVCYGEKEQYELALEWFLRALEARPELALIHIDVANAAHKAGRPELSEEHLNRALALDGCPPRATFMLWETLTRSGRDRQARALLRELLEREDLPQEARTTAEQLFARGRRER